VVSGGVNVVANVVEKDAIGTKTCMEALVVRNTLVIATLLATVGCTKKIVETTITPEPSAAVSAQLAAPLNGALGAPSARGAVEGFLSAVKTQDLRGMSAMWGNDKGPTADRIPREELEKRLIVMQCMLAHEQMAFAEDSPRLVTGGRQVYLVELKKQELSGKTKFTTVVGQGGRWFVEDIDMAPLKEFCR
jgi:hypothetical protein